ncbi:Asparagine synthetase [Magnetospirillum sp. LM-5]|uniref:asparagine synthase (glutamine-hydrolyzing) n=1 Tax=Magnetospirillum sp. LM-5 TaxID=2681466 RepID=UPI001380A3DC|nr:asparagine synthase (glutamine-hydrolyzing) [Magnetospirillum sp. LM-5]CAA7618762.1 Asparagine synthetase [Magnetospirillum sp. LM-5]
MCGIWASVGLTVSRAVIDAVAHRGPDGEGWREAITPAGQLVLGHRRLAIVDLSLDGAQPMTSSDGRYTVVYNGEIYNHPELRLELAAAGHRFNTCSDTEVLIAAYAQWGESCLNRFNGMFAFVLWDSAEHRLFLARDRFGVKPLYLWQSPDGGLAVASEIKQFLALPGFATRLDHVAAYDFLTWGVFDHSARTMFAGVSQLRGGECATVSLASSPPALQVRRWYSLPRAGTLRLGPETAIERFAELIDDSVALRLRSDVPVGACLSGGLDSSAIVCLAANRTASPIVTVSARYDGQAIDEGRFIDIVNAAVPTRPIAVHPDGTALSHLLDRLAFHQDGPFSSTSVFAQWCVFAAARREGVPVMLDGQGADEQLAGYHPAFTAYHSGLLRHGRMRTLVAELAAQRRRHGVTAAWQAAVLARALLPDVGRRALRRLRGLGRPDWLRGEACRSSHDPLPATVGLETLIESQMQETSLPMLLHYEDRNSMAHGIESRLPFLDYRLVELAVGLGERHKIVDGETKWLLRRAMQNILPPAIRDRQDKIGFATPEKSWLAGPSRAIVETMIAEASSRFPDLFRPAELAHLKDEVLSGRRPFDFTLWRIVSFAAWGRAFGVTG